MNKVINKYNYIKCYYYNNYKLLNIFKNTYICIYNLNVGKYDNKRAITILLQKFITPCF